MCLETHWIAEGYSSKNHEKKFFEKGKVYLSGYLKYGFNKKNLPIALESPFVVPLDVGLKIGGKIDRVDKLSDGEIEIIDYKTGATIPSQKEVDENLQLSFYALAATKVKTPPFGKIPEKVKLSLYFLDTQEKISTIRTKEQLFKATKEIIKVKKDIESSSFECSNHIFCQNNCEYSLFCKSDS